MEAIGTVQLGMRCFDIITNFEGIASGETRWLYGCKRIAIEPETLRDGKPVEMQWFDEQRVKVHPNQADTPLKSIKANNNPGGPQRDPMRHGPGN